MSSRVGRILVADDEPQLLRVVIRVLERDGYSVVSATDGDAALSAFRAAPDDISVVFLDAAIKPAGGERVLEALVTERPGIGVIVASGAQIREEFHDLLFRHDGIFLRKPFPPASLLRAVEDSLIKADA